MFVGVQHDKYCDTYCACLTENIAFAIVASRKLSAGKYLMLFAKG